jgi:hypothetical protein
MVCEVLADRRGDARNGCEVSGVITSATARDRAVVNIKTRVIAAGVRIGGVGGRVG